MLRDEIERSLISETLTKPYVDPVSKGSRGSQIDLVRKLLRVGLFRVNWKRRGTVGMLLCSQGKDVFCN